MNLYEKIAFVLNICLLVFIIVKFINLWSMAAALLVLMIIILLYKINFDIRFDLLNKRSSIIENISKQLENLAQTTLNIRDEFRKSVFMLEHKINAQKDDIELKMNNNYRELAKKVIELENRMNSTKKSLANYISYLEDLLKHKHE